jgi:hypothetical protein
MNFCFHIDFISSDSSYCHREKECAMSACICSDCGIDTTPRIDLWEFYMVTEDVWKAPGKPASTLANSGFDGNYLCVGCSELRIGCRLAASDFSVRPLNDLDHREGGVSTPGWFNVVILFQNFEAALAGEREFRDHGYVVEFLDEIDDYSNATFLTVSRLAGTATCDEFFDAAIQLANRLDGDADNAWISDGGSELAASVH